MNRKPTENSTGRKDEVRESYEPPAIQVFTEEEIAAQLGPAQLYSGSLPFQW